MSVEYIYKRSVTKGINYMQIWKRDETGKEIYVCSLGSAQTLYKKLVLANLIVKQTNTIDEIPTNFSKVEQIKND
jgi:glutamate synthase domain-containing protein 1